MTDEESRRKPLKITVGINDLIQARDIIDRENLSEPGPFRSGIELIWHNLTVCGFPPPSEAPYWFMQFVVSNRIAAIGRSKEAEILMMDLCNVTINALFERKIDAVWARRWRDIRERCDKIIAVAEAVGPIGHDGNAILDNSAIDWADPWAWLPEHERPTGRLD